MVDVWMTKDNSCNTADIGNITWMRYSQIQAIKRKFSRLLNDLANEIKGECKT